MVPLLLFFITGFLLGVMFGGVLPIALDEFVNNEDEGEPS